MGNSAPPGITQRRSQLDGVQALRFVAAFFVVIGHATYYAFERLGLGGSYWHGGGRGVDLFFAISGFVMILSSRRLVGVAGGWKQFAFQRLTRVVPLYWVATTAKLVALVFAARYVLHARIEWDSVIKSYLFVPTKNQDGVVIPLLGVGWTLVYEMFFYAIFTISLAIRANTYWFTGVVLAGFAAASFWRPADFAPLWVYCDPIVLEFLFGMLVAALYLRGYKLRPPTAIGIILISFIILLLPLDDLLGVPRVVVAGIPAAFVLWAVASLEVILQGRIPAVVLFFGAASYSLYLFHPICSPIAPELLRKLRHPNWAASVALSIAMSLAAGAIIYLLIELPLTRLVRHLPGLRRQTHPSIIDQQSTQPTV